MSGFINFLNVYNNVLFFGDDARNYGSCIDTIHCTKLCKNVICIDNTRNYTVWLLQLSL